MRLLSITKLQNLKAIHNGFAFGDCLWLVVINHKTTKFENNSQLLIQSVVATGGCYQSQNYKIWKQFTTLGVTLTVIVTLLSITKLQNLKAIHNISALFHHAVELLSITKLQNLKAIHNPKKTNKCLNAVVINHKTTKFESNSQRFVFSVYNSRRCYQSQNYKIWKQFTTRGAAAYSMRLLLSITKLQNLKAIHNSSAYFNKEKQDVINHKTTKFESNSQPYIIVV